MEGFIDREDGAKKLLPKLRKFQNAGDAVVVGLPRGGMVTASVIAGQLGLPLGFLIVKKIGAPGDPELAIGAVSEDGEILYDEELAKSADQKYKESESKIKYDEARERGRSYRGGGNVERFDGKIVILVDDGIATGTTMLCAVKSAKKRGAKKVTVAVPVASSEGENKIKKEAELIVFGTDPMLASVGEFYEKFPQIEDPQVLEIIKNAKNNSFNK